MLFAFSLSCISQVRFPHIYKSTIHNSNDSFSHMSVPISNTVSFPFVHFPYCLHFIFTWMCYSFSHQSGTYLSSFFICLHIIFHLSFISISFVIYHLSTYHHFIYQLSSLSASHVPACHNVILHHFIFIHVRCGDVSIHH